MAVNTQIPSQTLGGITPAQEWSQDTQDEILGRASLANNTAADPAHLGVTPSQAGTAPYASSQAPMSGLHPGGQIPEGMTSTPGPAPISPVTMGAGQPGYGSVPMYAGEAPQNTMAGAQPPAPPGGMPTYTEAAPTTTVRGEGPPAPPPGAVPVHQTVTTTYATGPNAANIKPVAGLFQPAPPPLARYDSAASTAMDIPGAWGEDKPCEFVC